jgi:TonB-dependent receptor
MKKSYLWMAVKTALIAPLAAGATMGSAMAQEANSADDAANVEVIQVRGIRGSLEQSLSIKRASSQVVDAISSEDVGKFPDANVAESLQRITGVAIDRNGGEGQFITVRGLGPEFNTVLLNGRTLATDNDGREFSFDVLSSDIIQRAEVFKSAIPELQSGGIGATVNIVTARPLENPVNSFNFSASGIYEDQRGDVTPEFSVLGNWVNEDQTYGFSGGISYSDRATQLDTVNTNGFADRAGAPVIFAPENSVGLTNDDVGVLPAGARVQQQVVVSRDLQDRERLTLNGAFQARPNDKLEVTVDALYTTFEIDSFATQFSGFFDIPFLAPQIDENGTVVSFNRPSLDFQARNPDATAIGLSQNDNVLTSNNREADSYLVGLNLQYDVNDSLSLNFDVSASNATRDQTNPFVVLGALAQESPLIQLPDDAEISTLTNIVGAQDTSIQRLHFVNVNRQEVEDDIVEVKGGGEYVFESGSLSKITFGASYSDRSKERVQFDNFSASQGAGIFCAFCGYTVDFDDNILSQVNLDDFLSGVSGSDRIPLNFLTASFEDAFAQLNSDAAINDPARTGVIPAAELIARRDAAGDSIFGFFEPDRNDAASFRVDEEVTSGFINTFWEGGDTIPWSANIGFRIDRTETTSFGVDQPVVQFRESVGDTQLEPIFGDATQISVSNSYTNFLPSANIKFDLTDDIVLRAAYSETVTRPTLTSLGVNNTFGGRSNAPTSGGGNPNLEAFESANYDIAFEWYVDEISFVGLSVFYKDFSNFLEAATLPVPGELVIPAGNVANPSDEDITVPITFQDTRTRNGEEGNLTGLEVALQKGWENGFGASLNYTYVDSDIDRALDSGASDCDYNGLSPNTVNLSGFFENDKWSARVSYNYRDEFLVQCFAEFSEPREREEFGQVDLSASYSINDTYQVFFEGINVLDEERRDFSRFENRFLTLEDTGPRYTFGIRGSF